MEAILICVPMGSVAHLLATVALLVPTVTSTTAVSLDTGLVTIILQLLQHPRPHQPLPLVVAVVTR